SMIAWAAELPVRPLRTITSAILSRSSSWSLIDCSFDCLNSRARPFGLAFRAPVSTGCLVAFDVQFEHLVQCVQGAREHAYRVERLLELAFTTSRPLHFPSFLDPRLDRISHRRLPVPSSSPDRQAMAPAPMPCRERCPTSGGRQWPSPRSSAPGPGRWCIRSEQVGALPNPRTLHRTPPPCRSSSEFVRAPGRGARPTSGGRTRCPSRSLWCSSIRLPPQSGLPGRCTCLSFRASVQSDALHDLSVQAVH